jgi:hypothetical protein
VKAVFDAAIKVVIRPVQKQKEKKKKPHRGCLSLVPFFLQLKGLLTILQLCSFFAAISHCVWTYMDS